MTNKGIEPITFSLQMKHSDQIELIRRGVILI